MRDINEGQTRELEAEKGRIKELQSKRRELTQELEDARKATAAQADELEVGTEHLQARQNGYNHCFSDKICPISIQDMQMDLVDLRHLWAVMTPAHNAWNAQVIAQAECGLTLET